MPIDRNQPATKGDLVGLATKKWVKSELRETTNIIIGEISRDMRRMEERLTQSMDQIKSELRGFQPRTTLLENQKDLQEQQLRNHEARITNLESKISA